ncbi:uncharacterized protein LOC115993057 isoform X2 [Quercus lobata]|uniref:uncharacterized protein LOC115993057 isoform X2 n=1 Tax=Quercus lobata TaxID=97700 RepID=UPI001243EF87|nr:uncharacterized protein LOC115993057 isoform X2 [Quercus lobata]XP_030973199.1 uncharacterized protein LOC115993057 isoform X2 [Quercus lobata]
MEVWALEGFGFAYKVIILELAKNTCKIFKSSLECIRRIKDLSINRQKKGPSMPRLVDCSVILALKQEDWEFFWKLVAVSVVGAAIIKYGSVVFPEITRPNIIQALIMISTPVIVAVFLLIKQSRAESGS